MLGENKHYSRHRKHSTKSMMNHDFTEKKAIFFLKNKLVQRVSLEKKFDNTF